MTTATASADELDGLGNRLARRNARLLAVAQAMAGANAAVVFATGGLVGHMLHPDKTMATVPLSTFVLGTAIATIPASFLMRAVGRRAGFVVGALLGGCAGLLAAFAVWIGSFAVFCGATATAGAYHAFVTYYRFAAADTATPAFRPKAISWVLTGGVAAAIVGPQLVIHTKDLLPPYLFVATYVGQAAFAFLSIGALVFLRAPPPAPERFGSGRSIAGIARDRRFIVALACGMGSYAVMNFVMTSAPLAMVACNHSVTDATLGIQWHVLAMFAPSFVTGNLIARHGKTTIMLCGLAMLAAAAAVALSGLALWQFWLALILLGVGWNFAFVSATAMVTDCHTAEERAKVQAFNDFSIFAVVAASSFTSGQVLARAGWETVNGLMLAVVLVLFIVLAVGGWWRRAAPSPK